MTDNLPSMAVKRNRLLGAKVHGHNTFPGPVFALVLCSLFSLLWTGRAHSQAVASLSEQIVGAEFLYAVQSGESLSSIGARFGVTVAGLTARNNLASTSHLKIGQLLMVDNRHIVPPIANNGIVINIPQRMLFYFYEGRLIHAFPVALGRPGWPTPTGPFKVVVKERNPTWDVPKSIQDEMRREGRAVRTCVPPGPDNPLGKHWLGLSMGGYGIHGTNAPASIYRFQTHGCIRLHPDDIARLFDDVSIGTPATLIYHRLMIAKVGAKIYLEVHDDVYGKEVDIRSRFEAIIASYKLESMVDRNIAADIIAKHEGIAREINRRIGAGNSR